MANEKDKNLGTRTGTKSGENMNIRSSGNAGKGDPAGKSGNMKGGTDAEEKGGKTTAKGTGAKSDTDRDTDGAHRTGKDKK